MLIQSLTTFSVGASFPTTKRNNKRSPNGDRLQCNQTADVRLQKYMHELQIYSKTSSSKKTVSANNSLKVMATGHWRHKFQLLILKLEAMKPEKSWLEVVWIRQHSTVHNYAMYNILCKYSLEFPNIITLTHFAGKSSITAPVIHKVALNQQR